MSRAKKRSGSEFEESELFSDQEFSLGGFIDAMEKRDVNRKETRKGTRQKLDDWQESQWLRKQLQDWDD